MTLTALRESSVSPIGDGGDELLSASLEACVSALSLIPEEVDGAKALAAAVSSQ